MWVRADEVRMDAVRVGAARANVRSTKRQAHLSAASFIPNWEVCREKQAQVLAELIIFFTIYL